MLSILSLTAGALVLVVTMLRPTTGFRLYLIVLLFAPYVHLGDVVFRIEFVLAPMLLVVILVTRPNSLRAGLPPLTPLWALWWLFLVCVTVVEVVVLRRNDDVMWINAYAFLRPFTVVAAFYLLRSFDQWAVRVLRLFCILAIPLALLAVAQVLGVHAASVFTTAAYTSTTRGAAIESLLRLGNLTRGVAVFETPAFAGVYFAMVIGVGLLLLEGSGRTRSSKRWPIVLGTGAGLIGGVATLSATFLLAAAVPLLAAIWMGVSRRRVGLVFGVFLIAALATLLMRHTASGEDLTASSLRYQLDRIASGSVFDTRFGASGIVVPALSAIGDQPVTGYGFSTAGEVFLGDSLYITLLYTGGLIGLLLVAAILLRAYRSMRRAGLAGDVGRLWCAVLMASGFAAPTLFIPRVQDWWWALVGLCSALAADGLRRIEEGTPGRVARDGAKQQVVAVMP